MAPRRMSTGCVGGKVPSAPIQRFRVRTRSGDERRGAPIRTGEAAGIAVRICATEKGDRFSTERDSTTPSGDARNRPAETECGGWIVGKSVLSRTERRRMKADVDERVESGFRTGGLRPGSGGTAWLRVAVRRAFWLKRLSLFNRVRPNLFPPTSGLGQRSRGSQWGRGASRRSSRMIANRSSPSR
jgi:hypothetical protein